PDVTVGAGTVLHNSVTVVGVTSLGAGCELFPGCVAGAPPAAVPEARGGACRIGDRNILREHVFIEAGAGGGPGTFLGDVNLLMVGCHVGHDARIEGEGIFANFTQIDPHGRIEKFVRTSGLTSVGSYATVGAYTFTTGYASVEADVPPYAIVQGLPSHVRCVNVENLRRCGFDEETIRLLKASFRALFNGRGDAPSPRMLQEVLEGQDNEHVRYLVESLRSSLASPTGKRLEAAGAADGVASDGP
ncbi:MAG TPA: hypothetical protein VFJ30_00955, partial [Phycisphaerae bacterium]|nr:hypothetical protein [Phycisphaerae bacterium]